MAGTERMSGRQARGVGEAGRTRLCGVLSGLMKEFGMCKCDVKLLGVLNR